MKRKWKGSIQVWMTMSRKLNKASLFLCIVSLFTLTDWTRKKGKISFLLVHERMSKCLSSMFKVYVLNWTKQLQMSSNRHVSGVGVRFYFLSLSLPLANCASVGTLFQWCLPSIHIENRKDCIRQHCNSIKDVQRLFCIFLSNSHHLGTNQLWTHLQTFITNRSNNTLPAWTFLFFYFYLTICRMSKDEDNHY